MKLGLPESIIDCVLSLGHTGQDSINMDTQPVGFHKNGQVPDGYDEPQARSRARGQRLVLFPTRSDKPTSLNILDAWMLGCHAFHRIRFVSFAHCLGALLLLAQCQASYTTGTWLVSSYTRLQLHFS